MASIEKPNLFSGKFNQMLWWHQIRFDRLMKIVCFDFYLWWMHIPCIVWLKLDEINWMLKCKIHFECISFNESHFEFRKVKLFFCFDSIGMQFRRNFKKTNLTKNKNKNKKQQSEYVLKQSNLVKALY